MYPQTRIANLNRSQAAWLSLILALSLLFVQWLGLAHAVSHANLNAGTAAQQTELSFSSTSVFEHQKSASICALLDAATLGAALHTPAVIAPIFAAIPLHHLAASGSGWTEPFRAYFSSRAPPLRT